jgi:adhesin transport system outer membrane protein
VKKSYFASKILLSCLLLGQVAIAEKYKKVVLASYETEPKAQIMYDKLLGGIESKLEEEKAKYPFSVIMRKSGSHYIIAAEPFKYLSEAKDVLEELKSNFPTAYINNNADSFDETDSSIMIAKPKIKELVLTPKLKEKIEVIPVLKPTVVNQTQSLVEKKYTLEQMLRELVYTDPEIKERLFQYNATMEEVEIAEADYYPTIDLIGKTGKKETKKEGINKDKYDTSEVTLRLVQNLFDGFGTDSAVDRDEARAKAAFNKYIEVAQDKMYRAIEAYIKVVRYKEVLEIAKDNVKIHEETLIKIQNRYDKGFSTLSEVERVKGRLALSKSNYVSETNNLFDAKFNFHKSLGRTIDENDLVMPSFEGTLPKTLEHAGDIAIHKNPSILVANYDIKATQQALQYAEKNDYPKLDLEIERSRYNNLTGSSVGSQDDLSAMLVLNYNLYSGGEDKAKKQKYVSLINYEYAHKNKLKRDVLEALGLSWSAHKMISEQYKYQIEYRDLTAKTKAAYNEEFQLGRRTLIDLLDVQDEVNNIKIKVIHNKYDLLFAKYRILDAMGELYQSFGHEFKEEYKEDTNLTYADQDNDKIIDCEDQCDNSIAPKTVNIYGCEGINCVQVDEIKFDAEIKENSEQVDTTEIQNLWGVKN